MKRIALLTILSSLFGCTLPDMQILDGPGMVYTDSDYRTEYANTLPFDEYEEYPFWAVAFLGRGETGEANRQYYIDRLFSDLSADSIAKIRHFDFEGDEWYLIIPRYTDENDIIPLCGDGEKKRAALGEAFTVKCSSESGNPNIKVVVYIHGGHEFSPQTDSNGKLICGEYVRDITEYE